MILHDNKQNMARILFDIHEDNFYDIDKFLCPASRYNLGISSKTVRLIVGELMKRRSEHIFMHRHDKQIVIAHAFTNDDGEWFGYINYRGEMVSQYSLRIATYKSYSPLHVFSSDTLIIGTYHISNFEKTATCDRCDDINDHTNKTDFKKKYFIETIYYDDEDKLLVHENDYGVTYMKNTTYTITKNGLYSVKTPKSGFLCELMFNFNHLNVSKFDPDDIDLTYYIKKSTCDIFVTDDNRDDHIISFIPHEKVKTIFSKKYDKPKKEGPPNVQVDSDDDE